MPPDLTPSILLHMHRLQYLSGSIVSVGHKQFYNCLSLGEGTEQSPIKPKLKDLMVTLYHKMADKWEMMGHYLEIPSGQLGSITEKYQHDPHRCLVEMLKIWLERVHPAPTWTAIIEAVEFLGEGQLGKELREKYTVK